MSEPPQEASDPATEGREEPTSAPDSEPGTATAAAAEPVGVEGAPTPTGEDPTPPDVPLPPAAAAKSGPAAVASPVPPATAGSPTEVGTEAAAPVPAAPRAPAPAPHPSPAVLAARPTPPRPGAAPPPATGTDPVAAAAPGDPSRYGRVTADGTVLVRLPDGSERPVGQWAAGQPAEGLAFFARKFDDLLVEVDLATRRVRDRKAAADQAAAVVRKAREALAEPAMVGDLAALEARVSALEALIADRQRAAAEERSQAHARALAAREAIATEAESLAESSHWKAAGDRFKELLATWKATPRADRAAEQELWKRFSHARSTFDKRRRQHFAKLDSERGEVRQVKEAIVKEAEALSSSTDWGATAGAYRDLMARWKAAGRAGKADEERLWERFRAAQDAFFSARNKVFETRDAGQRENLAAKLTLLTEAEAIDTRDLATAKVKLRSVQERWEAIGHVPRGDKERVEARLRKVEEAVRRGDQEQWRRTNPEARARAEDTVAQFRGSLQRLQDDLAAAQSRGDDRAAADLQTRIDSTTALLQAAERAAEEFSG